MFYTPQVDLYTTELLSLVVHIIYFNGLLFFVIFYIYSQNTQLFEIPSDKLLLATCDVLKCKTEFFFCSHHGDTRPGFSSEINPIHNWYKCLIVVNKIARFLLGFSHIYPCVLAKICLNKLHAA